MRALDTRIGNDNLRHPNCAAGRDRVGGGVMAGVAWGPLARTVLSATTVHCACAHAMRDVANDSGSNHGPASRARWSAVAGSSLSEHATGESAEQLGIADRDQ